jgi:hypothetical protein
MNSNEINVLIEKLSWNMPEDVQNKAIDLLKNIDDEKIGMLVQPIGKPCWENAAIVLKKIGYPRIKQVIPKLLEWLQDMNWPGACIILDLLQTIDKKVLVLFIEDALIKANIQKDYIWIAGIKLLVDKLSMTQTDFNRKEVYELLELAEW